MKWLFASDWVNWIRWPKRSLICAVRCGERWQALFDIVTFFWNELHARSRRLLQKSIFCTNLRVDGGSSA